MNYHIDFDIDFKRNTYPGKFIALEGIDGAGKTTQVADIAKKLSPDKVFLTKTPSDNIIGKLIRQVLSKQVSISSKSIQYLYTADRQDQQEEIESYLKKGYTVISDRYFWSSVAYGMVDKGIDNFDEEGDILLVAYSILSAFNRFLLPDLTIYLDIPPAVAVKRLADVDKVKEIYEKEDSLKKVYGAYKWLIKKFPKEITVVDGTRPEKEITDLVLPLVLSAKK